MNISEQSFNSFAPDAYLGHEAMEFLALEGYRAGTLSHAQASDLLGMSYFQFDAFLKDRHIHDQVEERPN
jgi:predicted HTH domain antitoxin